MESIKVIEGKAPQGEDPVIEVITWPSPLDPTVTIAQVQLFRSVSSGGRSAGIFSSLLPTATAKISHEEAVAVGCQKARELGLDRIYASKSA